MKITTQESERNSSNQHIYRVDIDLFSRQKKHTAWYGYFLSFYHLSSYSIHFISIDWWSIHYVEKINDDDKPSFGHHLFNQINRTKNEKFLIWITHKGFSGLFSFLVMVGYIITVIGQTYKEEEKKVIFSLWFFSRHPQTRQTLN